MKLIKEEVNTVSRWGDIPERRGVEEALPRSVFVLDKPQGPTSHQVSSWVQEIFGMKAGHSGTLDPNVTGVLPMGLGFSVRLTDLMHVTPKEYVAAMKFHGTVKKSEVEDVFKEYVGEIYQMPPVRSGVKRERRIRKIHEIELLDYQGREYLFRVRCQSGTYIRTLCKDLGKSMGVRGHMMELRRTEGGGFVEEESHPLTEFKDSYEFYKDGSEDELMDILLPYERVLGLYPSVVVKDTAAGSLLNGADLAVPGVMKMDEFSAGEMVSILSPKGEGIAIGEALLDAEDIMEMDKGLIVRTDRVFHPSGEYPRSWK
ncbi:MAG: RNA-guided pseudouridylation complex pseudouridine synthase subunit Cbf5 [Thermoplasmata archaeon]